MSDTPDYRTLVELFPILRNFVDGCGEVTLTAEEAQRIQSLGFAARAGPWKVPPVPPELVRDHALLEHLSIGWKPAQAEAIPNGPSTKNRSCEVAQIIEGSGQPVLAATHAERIRLPINVSEQKADSQASSVNRIRPAPARTIRQDSELAVPSEQMAKGGDDSFLRRRWAGYQLPRTPQEHDRMAEEAASRIERTLNMAYREGKRMNVRDLQQRHWRFPASVFHQALHILERRSRILYQFNRIRVTPFDYGAKRLAQSLAFRPAR